MRGGSRYNARPQSITQTRGEMARLYDIGAKRLGVRQRLLRIIPLSSPYTNRILAEQGVGLAPPPPRRSAQPPVAFCRGMPPLSPGSDGFWPPAGSMRQIRAAAARLWGPLRCRTCCQQTSLQCAKLKRGNSPSHQEKHSSKTGITPACPSAVFVRVSLPTTWVG
ncbi:hypothetical protein VUR80DRAFT_7883 [Thermomyces stellatus]